MDKHYIFKDDSWWDNNGCDCCEDTFMECYNSEQTSCNLGSANSVEECYLQAIVTEKGWLFWDDIPESYREMHLDELVSTAKEIGITVVVK